MPLPLEVVDRIASAHEIGGGRELMAASGMVNEAWLLDGRYVLRITVNEDGVDEAAREAWVVPLVRSAGILSPELIVEDSTRSVVEFPYTIYARAEGELLGHLESDPSSFSRAYCELGREIASLHAIEITEELRRGLRESFTYADYSKVAETLDAGKINHSEAREIEKWIETLTNLISDRSRRAFLHQDIHPWNILVHPTTKALTAIIDWGDAAWGDPAGEFSSMPLVAMPTMFSGYVEAGGHIDEGMRARALLLGLGLQMWELRELDELRFNRRWWRHTQGGFDQAFSVFEKVLAH